MSGRKLRAARRVEAGPQLLRLARYDGADAESSPSESRSLTVPDFQPRLAAPAALAAFLRGVERRGAVLAELQCGDARGGDAALTAAMVDFRAAAGQAPMAAWPRTFWARLLAQPRLRHRTAVAIALDATDSLAELGSGPRAALLLRLAAGLPEADAAAVLGVAEPTYRLALRRALPSHPDGRADPEAWQRLREQVHRRIKTLPQDRLLRLAGAREAALLGQAAGVSPPADAVLPPAWPRPLLPLVWTLLALCVAGLAATFWWPGDGAGSAGGDGAPVRVQPLPAAQAPASGYGRESGLIAHRDFALLTDPLAEANSRDLDFHSWLAAQDAAAADGTPVLPVVATATQPLTAGDADGADQPPGEMGPDDAPR